MSLAYEHIKKFAVEAGFTLCGVARARVLSEHGARFAAGLAASGQAALKYLTERPERRFDPCSLMPDARTVVVCALKYDGRAMDSGEGKVAAHRRLGDYQPKIKAMLSGVLERLQSEAGVACREAQRAGGHHSLRGKVCCDTSAILEKAWAVEAGLGWQGRNSLLINPVHGSFLLLGEIVLDAASDRYDEPHTGMECGECRRCIAACPAGALGETADGTKTLDTGRCISALTIERVRKGKQVEPLHGWIYGCDECQTACPYNKNEK